jgi:hypothetical protein
VVSSTDGFCSFLRFEEGELGQELVKKGKEYILIKKERKK